MSKAELVYASLALFLGVIKLLMDYSRNEILEGTRQAVLLVYEEVQNLDKSVQDGCNDIVWTINGVVNGEETEEEEDGAGDKDELTPYIPY